MPVPVLARCVHGLEWVCADEIAQLPGAAHVRLARREVAFDVPALEPELLGLRTVDDVFLAVGSGIGTTSDGIADTVRHLPWEERVDDVRGLRPVPAAPVLDVVAGVEGHRFSRYAVEHTVGPLLATRLGGTYLRRTAAGREPGEPDLTVRVSVREGAATAAVRVGARPLHRRGWKRDTGPGTLHPPVAAALARLAGPAPEETVLDPFCGDGTIAIETALAFPAVRVAGSDLDPSRLTNAGRNVERAGVSVTLARADAGQAAARADVVITNPPWNLAVDGAGTLHRGLGPLWRRLPALLEPAGRLVVVTDAELDAPSALLTAGFALGVVETVRVAGRVSHVVLAAAGVRPELTDALRAWREGAAGAGVTMAP